MPTLSQDKTLLIPGEGDKQFECMNAEQVERLITQLGHLRSQMIPPVPKVFALDMPVVQPISGCQHLFAKDQDGNSLSGLERGMALALRSEGYGWQILNLSAHDCAALQGWIEQGVNAIPAGVVLN